MSRTCLLWLLLAAAIGCPPNRPPATENQREQEQERFALRQVQDLEAERSFGEKGWLLEAVHDQRLTVAEAALRALGRIGAPTALPAVVRGLSSPFPSLRREAAHSAQLLTLSEAPLPGMGRIILEQTLVVAEEAEIDLSARQAELSALGALGSKVALLRLAERLLGPGELRAEAAIALGTAAQRGAVVPSEALESLAQLSRSDDERHRRAAVFALAQLARSEMLPALRDSTQDLDAEVRAWAVNALGKSVALHDAGRLANLAVRERDLRVRAELARALAAHARRCAPAASCGPVLALQEMLESLTGLRGGLVEQDAWPIQVLSEEELPPAGRELWIHLRERLRTIAEANPTLQRTAGQLDCRAAVGLDRIEGTLRQVLGCGLGVVPLGERYRQGLEGVSLSTRFRQATQLDALLPLLSRPEPALRTAAVAALGRLGSSGAVAPLRGLLESEELPLAVAAAEALGALNAREALPEIRRLSARVGHAPELVSRIAALLLGMRAVEAEPELQMWCRSRHIHVRREGRRVLAALGLQEVPAQALAEPPLALGNWPLAPTPGTRLVLVTEVGDIAIELDSLTPLNGGNLFQLARRGFFNDLMFHQVSPYDAVWSGDPRGDGRGGPGYTVPSEATATAFEEGAVGMVNFGQDTGGSQFFIVTRWQPLLAGTTRVGRVVEGLEVVRRVLPGTRIERARIELPLPPRIGANDG